MDIVETDEMRTRNHRSARRFYRTNFAQQRTRLACPRWRRVLIVMMIVVTGNPHASAEELVNNLHFPGHYYDEESGLYCNWNRYYNPRTGRYITSDPIGLVGGINTYSYSNSNPTNLVDVNGLAYFALRSLEGLHGKPTCGKTVGDMLNLQLAHEQLFFEDGKSPGNVGFFSDGAVREDRPQNLPKYTCRRGDYDDCIMRVAYKNVPGGDYCLLPKPGPGKQNNCQNWADRVRLEYARVQDTEEVAHCRECVE